MSSEPVQSYRTPILLVGGFIALVIAVGLALRTPPEPVKIGVIHSLTGTMAGSEQPLVDVLRMAVNEANRQGGVLGRPLELVVRDTRSEPAVAASAAEYLIDREGVQVLFGCWTSSCRKAVKPVVERRNHLLVYPLQYEGLEQSPNILYTGLAPNQQIIPGAVWATDNLGARVYLVGSDYVFPRVANALLKDVIGLRGGQIVGERYVPLGSTNVEAVIDDIRRGDIDVIMNTINGSSNLALFRALANVGQDVPPVMSFSVSEVELADLPDAPQIEHYGVWSYFQTLDTEQNRNFLGALRAELGSNPAVGDPMATTYVGFRLWVNSVRESGEVTPAVIRGRLKSQSLLGPSGLVSVDGVNLHLWHTSRVGRVTAEGQYDQLWASDRTIKPEPFPSYRSQLFWHQKLEELEGRQ